MAPVSLVLAGLVGASYVVFVFLNKIVIARRHAARAREWGCQEPPLEPLRYPLGIDKILGALEADKQKAFPDYVIRRAERVGSWTWQYYIAGTRVISTQDPDNIKAILATQFGAYDLGSQRRDNVCPSRPPCPN